MDLRFGIHFGDGPSPVRCDQKDKFQYIHFFRDKVSEHWGGFFPKDNGGRYVLENELILSKVVDAL